MKIYEALFNPMIHESATAVLSVHKTRKGAEIALTFHKKKIKDEWEEMFIGSPEMQEFSWDFCKWWGVKEIELLD